MKKFFKWVLISLLVLTGLYFIIGLFAPSHYKVERSKTFMVPVEAIYPNISSLKNWNSWSAWARMDTAAVYTYEGTDGAVGSVMKWKGDPEKTGEGRMEITELIPNQKVSYKLSFVDFNMTSTGSLSLTPSGDSTKITWSNEGDIPYLMRTMAWIMFDMDAMMGSDFEKGLTNLGEVSAASALAMPSYQISEIAFGDAAYIGVRYDTLISAIDSTIFSSAYVQLGEYFDLNKIEMMGMPVCITTKWDEVTGRCDLVAAFPVRPEIKMTDPRFVKMQFDNPQALVLDYYGEYSEIWKAHMAMDAYLAKHAAKTSVSIEEYITDPATVSTYDSVLTKLYYILE